MILFLSYNFGHRENRFRTTKVKLDLLFRKKRKLVWTPQAAICSVKTVANETIVVEEVSNDSVKVIIDWTLTI